MLFVRVLRSCALFVFCVLILCPKSLPSFVFHCDLLLFLYLCVFFVRALVRCSCSSFMVLCRRACSYYCYCYLFVFVVFVRVLIRVLGLWYVSMFVLLFSGILRVMCSCSLVLFFVLVLWYLSFVLVMCSCSCYLSMFLFFGISIVRVPCFG